MAIVRIYLLCSLIEVIDASLAFSIVCWTGVTISLWLVDDLIVDPRNLEWMREANCPVVSDCSFLTCILTVRTVLFFVLRLEEYILFRYVAAAQSCCSIYKHGKEVLFMWSKLLNSLPRIFIRESLRIFMI